MAIFYGIYLRDPRISAAFDLIRFLAEPDALRSTHITLRGPYATELPQHQVDLINNTIPGEWSVFVSGPGSFYGPSQNTVILRVELNELASIVRKPDFRDAVAHLTLYDGRDRAFADELLNLCWKYDFYSRLPVTKLTKIGKKAPLAGNSMEFYPEFRDAFSKIVGEESSPSSMYQTNAAQRLYYITQALDFYFEKHINKLNVKPPKLLLQNLDFGFPLQRKR